MKKATFFSLLDIFVVIPATLYLGTKITGRAYYLISTLVILELIVPFFLSFESRKPQSRELVTIAVMAALAAVSRVAFAVVPYFSPILGVIMLGGIAFGSHAGFLIGALSAFASNFYFSQGPWTPWQMFAYGFSGCLAGWIFHNRRAWCKSWILGIFGFFSVLCIIGPILDTSSVFSMLTEFTKEGVLVIYGQGVPVNIIHGLGSGLTLLLFGPVMLQKLDRLQTKYGMLDKSIDQ